MGSMAWMVTQYYLCTGEIIKKKNPVSMLGYGRKSARKFRYRSTRLGNS